MEDRKCKLCGHGYWDHWPTGKCQGSNEPYSPEKATERKLS